MDNRNITKQEAITLLGFDDMRDFTEEEAALIKKVENRLSKKLGRNILDGFKK